MCGRVGQASEAERYAAALGWTDYTVLVAQRSLNQARDALALSQLAQLRGGIALYKALGAGWSDTTLVPEPDQHAAAETTGTCPHLHRLAASP